jgi:hypothetical protein
MAHKNDENFKHFIESNTWTIWKRKFWS